MPEPQGSTIGQEKPRYPKTRNFYLLCMYYAGQNGSLGLIVPIEELVYRRLSMLQNFLVTQFWQNGGLNPKSFRQSFVDDRYLHNVEKNILDGDLLCKFYNLSVYERQQLTRHMGTSVAQVLNDLEEIQRANLLI